MRYVTATVLFPIEVKVGVGIDTSPGALRDAILGEAELRAREIPTFNPIILTCSDPDQEERKRYLKLGRVKKSAPAVTPPPEPSKQQKKPVKDDIGFAFTKKQPSHGKSTKKNH